MAKSSFLGNLDLDYIESQYQLYLGNPESMSSDWQHFFEGFELARKNFEKENKPGSELIDKEVKVLNLINAYRKRGHLFTKTNPVRTRRKYFPTLDIENYGLEKNDLNTIFHAGKEIGIGSATLKDIISHLNETYCHSIGVEYLFIREEQIVSWLMTRMEERKNTPDFSDDKKRRIFNYLVKAVGFEKFTHKKFVGQKRFSLEGAEGLIPALDSVIEKGSELGIEAFYIGMSHRGRLNVLTNIMQKPYENIFKEFTGSMYEEGIALGDVKYHLGYCTTITSSNGKEISLNLAPNPSHLETVSAIIEGISRGSVDNLYGKDLNTVASIIIHGDAAIASQGLVYEVAQMSQLEGYKTGGTIHLVINNQVGFTTNYLEARSSTYCTDIGKVIKAPIFHVNGDDVEAVVYVINLAMEFRQHFHRDVFIDILGYRKFGHNEGDEPRFTQPLLYDAIAKHPNPRDIYGEKLINAGVYKSDDIISAEKQFDDHLEEKLKESTSIDKVRIQRFFEDRFKKYKYSDEVNIFAKCDTTVNRDKLIHLASKINFLPADKKIFKKIVKLVNDRKQMVENDNLDWAMGELLAYASLAVEGHSVRLSGQDSERGTFSHRHASWTLEDTGKKYYPLMYLDENQAEVNVINSPLSEYGVMGFEYGYALAHPDGLTIWEAQFGDFYNVAQVIIDQYISSAEDKWGLLNGLVLYLPHGYEGQGPEHSSARIERFLTLCAGRNMQVANCTTPANLFHVLRRQVLRDLRVPLIIFTPKSLLRHPKCTSSLEEFEKGSFHEVIDDNNVDAGNVKRVAFCTGKIYYDLLEKKEEYNAKDIALIRIEQLHPFPIDEVRKIMYKYPANMLTLWVQEEPENMGAWKYIEDKMKEFDPEPVTRVASGSPATGLNVIHIKGQNEIINKVFRRCDCELQNVYCGLQCVVGKSREEIKMQHRYIFDDGI